MSRRGRRGAARRRVPAGAGTHADAFGDGHGHDDGHGHGHGHGHEDEHGHGHEDGHGHRHPRSQPPPPLPLSEARGRAASLERGAGAGKLLFFDAPSGVAGDMSVAALVDLGVPFGVVRSAVRALGIRGLDVAAFHVHVGAIGATRFEVRAGRQTRERGHGEIDRLIARAPLAPDAMQLARSIFQTLAEAESEVHRVPLASVHFHEVGAVDAIADIVGAAAALAWLGADVAASPLPMGRGFASTRHGPLPLPAPATLLCLRGVPTYDAGIDSELVTPTGAAIVATVATRFARWPALSPERVGWGAGTRVLPDRPNALRVVLGEPRPATPERSSHVVIEANVDDITGELAGHVLHVLLGAGALDAWASPVTGKKGRPGLVISALARDADADRIAAVLLVETTTLGVRRYPVARLERPRRVLEVETAYGAIPVKIAEGPFGPAQQKPEFDACVAAALRAGVPVREVMAAALAAVRALARGPRARPRRVTRRARG